MPIFPKDADFKYIFMNRQLGRLARVDHTRVEGKNDFDVFSEPVARLFRAQDEEVVRRASLIEFEETITLPEGIQTFMTSKFPLFDSEGRVHALGGVCTDITAQKTAQEALRKAHDELEQRVDERTAELERKTEKLMDTNVALRILLEKREEDRDELEKAVMLNVEKLVRPYIEKLKIISDKNSQKTFLEIVQANLDEITTSFTHNHKKHLSNLTPAQIQIVDLIKQGHTTKDIASLLNLSPLTIARHRQEIRKRLSLINKKMNLRTVLTANLQQPHRMVILWLFFPYCKYLPHTI